MKYENIIFVGDSATVSFVLITSIIDKNQMSDEEILREYKYQNSVEEAFRFLKSPVYLNQTLLNKKHE